MTRRRRRQSVCGAPRGTARHRRALGYRRIGLQPLDLVDVLPHAVEVVRRNVGDLVEQRPLHPLEDGDLARSNTAQPPHEEHRERGPRGEPHQHTDPKRRRIHRSPPPVPCRCGHPSVEATVRSARVRGPGALSSDGVERRFRRSAKSPIISPCAGGADARAPSRAERSRSASRSARRSRSARGWSQATCAPPCSTKATFRASCNASTPSPS